MENEFDFVVGYPRLFSKTTALRRLLKAEKIQRQHFLYVGDEVRNVEIAQIAAESLLAPARFRGEESFAGVTDAGRSPRSLKMK